VSRVEFFKRTQESVDATMRGMMERVKEASMIERTNERRNSQALFYDAVTDRRRQEYDRREQELAVPAIPGAIRPGVGEAAPLRERRRVPESGME
jgi:hypothetical protein